MTPKPGNRDSSPQPLHWLGLAELSRSIHSGRVSPLQLAQHFLERIEKLDPALNAFRAYDPEAVLRAARDAERTLESGETKGLLHGIPFAAKDLFDVVGMRTEAGSTMLGSTVAEQDAVVIARLRDAGMVLLGKTNTVEFAFGGVGINHNHGTPHNPWNVDPLVPGGSSSGSGVAVAAGLSPVALGTDTGGSVRVPAALCGTVGLQTTFGTVSRQGVFPLSRTRDSVGPLTRLVEDAALLFEVMGGPDSQDRQVWAAPTGSVLDRLHEGVRGLRIAVPENFFFDDVDPELVAAVWAAAEVFTGLGAELSTITFPAADAIGGADPHGLIVGAEAHAVHRERLDSGGDEMDVVVSTRLRHSRSITAADYLVALDDLAKVRAQSLVTFDEVDLLLVPTTMSPALPVSMVDEDLESYSHANNRYLRNTAVGNALGLCGLSLPCGFTSGGLPIGLMIYGRPFDEGTVLRAGEAYERATEWHSCHPDLNWVSE